MKNVEEEIKNLETEIAERLKKIEHLKQMKEDVQNDEILGRIFTKNENDSNYYCTPSIYNEVEYISLDGHSEEHIREIYKNGLLFNNVEECQNFSDWLKADKTLRDTIKVENYSEAKVIGWTPEDDYGVTYFRVLGNDVDYETLDNWSDRAYEVPQEYYMYNWVVADRILKKLGEEFIRFALLRR